MVERAAEAAGFGELKEFLKGPNAIVFLKMPLHQPGVLNDFAKKHEHLILKSGVVEGKVVDLNTIKELASLPNKEGMISMFLSCLVSPVTSFSCRQSGSRC